MNISENEMFALPLLELKDIFDKLKNNPLAEPDGRTLFTLLINVGVILSGNLKRFATQA